MTGTYRFIRFTPPVNVIVVLFILFFSVPENLMALVFPETELKIFQFPANMIPRIDGNPGDWDIVPEEYVYGTDILLDVEPLEPGNNAIARKTPVDPSDLDVRIRVGWVKGMNRLYVLYEAYDNYWDFGLPGTRNDILELVVDADLSGGDFIFQHFDEETYLTSPLQRGTHAQNYHICTPAVDKSWAMVWNCPTWLNKLPYLNCAYSYSFKHGESGRLIMECWITPFDYLSFHGPEYSALSRLEENSVIGFSWLIVDWDGGESPHALACLSHEVMMVHDGLYLRPFRLMPLEERFLKPIDADFTFTILDDSTRTVGFRDLSRGDITSWKWEFGDGATSTEQNPVHSFSTPGYANAQSATLHIKGPAGKSEHSLILEILFKTTR